MEVSFPPLPPPPLDRLVQRTETGPFTQNVNDASTNQMTLHTESGCSISSSTSFTGTANGTDCTYTANDNSGCGVTDSDTVSYGPEFAAAGGGVFITEFASTGIKCVSYLPSTLLARQTRAFLLTTTLPCVSIWFYARENIPAAISNATSSVDLSSLGTPAAAWSDSSCDIEKYFTAQQLIFDITLCGDWAGTASTLAETCPALSGSATCYTSVPLLRCVGFLPSQRLNCPPLCRTYVLDASNYDTAYFEVKSLRVYGSSSTNSTATSAAGRSTVGGGVLSWSTLAAGGLASAFAWFS